ncbi:hypothetical protein FOA24_38285 [Bacillus thuringiensis]|uniref:hypothetical protein n=1 Tax=Bacillus thuringiensis TaxID=1428 RepID=UPI00333BBBBD
MKKMKFVSGMCVAGMLVLGGMAGCGTNETKSTATQQESQKERDMKEADKAAMEYVRAYIDVDTIKLNELLYKKNKFYEEHVVNPGASKGLNNRYDLNRYDLDEGKNEYYYYVKYYDSAEKIQTSLELKVVKDEKDGKWKNYEWAWDSNNSLESIVGSMKPIHVHKWGQKE